MMLFLSGQDLRFYSGGAGGVNSALWRYAPDVGRTAAIWVAGVWDGTDCKIYGNGEYIAKATTPVAPNFNESTSFVFGQRLGNLSPWAGNMHTCDIWFDTIPTDDQLRAKYREDRHQFSRLYI